jgi:uncharacterized membrane protein YgcG
MTKYEKISILLSMIASCVTLAVPIIAYFWFNQKMAELRHHKPLLVDFYDSEKNPLRDFRILIYNPGAVPSREIVAVLTMDAPDAPDTPAPVIEFEPASPFKPETKGRVTTVSLGRPLGPGETLTIYVKPIQKSNGTVFYVRDVSVYSEIGSAIHRDHTTMFHFGGGRSGGRGASDTF